MMFSGNIKIYNVKYLNSIKTYWYRLVRFSLRLDFFRAVDVSSAVSWASVIIPGAVVVADILERF